METIEEHAKQTGLARSIVAAVMQAQGWASGKQVSAAAFATAVQDFLNAPMGERKGA